MFAKHPQNRFFLPVVTFLLILPLISGCGASTPTPTPAPPTVTLNVSPASQVQVGESVAIVAKVEPFEKLDLKWSVSGNSGGKLNTDTGGQVVYTAGNVGVDIVVVEGKTASGVPVQQTAALTIVAAPNTPAAPTPISPNAPAPVIVTPSLITPTMALPSSSNVTLTNIQEDQKVLCSNIARGLYPLDLKEYIWPVVYINGRYYPQDQAGKAARKEGGHWYQTVRFGDCNQPQNDVGKPFELIIVTANEAANAQFEEYIKTGPATGWAGLENLPSGAEEQVDIRVIRQ